MFGLAEKAQMLMHEKTLAYAAEHAAQNPEGRAEMAGAMQNAIISLVGTSHKAEAHLEFREIMTNMNSSVWHGTSSSLIQAAEQARTKHGLPLYYAFTILAGIIESRIIEVKRPNMASRTFQFRHNAFEFAEQMLTISRQLVDCIQDALSKSDKKEPAIKTGDLDQVEACLTELGYSITSYGAAIALLSLESGYTHGETASHLAVTTLAMDAKLAGDDITQLINLVPHARAMVDVLTTFKEAGHMREDLYANDARAILGVVRVGKDQPSWILRVLSDPVIGEERVATSRINY